MYFHPKP